MKVIVVEDNPVYNDYICNLLKKGGFDTAQAYRLSTAKKLLMKAGEEYIVLADLRLPDGEGIDLLRWMRKEEKPQPFIVMTDYAEVHTAVESMKLGSADYIPKLLVEDRLVPLIRLLHKAQEQKRQGQVPIFVRQGAAYQEIKRRVRLVAPTRGSADMRRERHGQGTHRPLCAYPKQTCGKTFRNGGLWSVVPDIGTVRLLRTRQRGIYGSRFCPCGVFSGSRRRHIVP